MSDHEHDDKKPQAKDNDSSRRDFLRAAAATGVGGAAALAAGTASAAGPKPTKRPVAEVKDYKARLTTTQLALTNEELSKDVKLKVAEALLKDLDNIEIQWVQGDIPAARRIIQIKG
jgi:hypothetical protein